MPRARPSRTRPQREGRRRARSEVEALIGTLRQAREDAGLSQRSLSIAAGLGPTAVRQVEGGDHEPSIGVLARIAAVLGGELSVRYYPGAGPRIRDHLQAAMLDALIDVRHGRWTASPEVWVTSPVKGVIDLLLSDGTTRVVCEAHSQLRRIEQQVRWLGAKVTAVAFPGAPPPSSLLLVRDCAATRQVAIHYAALISSAFPARHADAIAALVDDAPWPGPALVWMQVRGGRATLRTTPPRGVGVGR
ncbi:MAG: helix-turn-helix domain-containing protein [Candidatus Limnocylindrales bacterium]